MNGTTTGWITRASVNRPMPPSLPAGRETVLAAVLHPARVPTLPAMAVQIVEVASRPNCRATEIIEIARRDPGLSAELLRAANSAEHGLGKPVGSIDRAVLVLGLNRVRALALGLSLPAMRPENRQNPAVLDYSLATVGGAIIARELAIRLRDPEPEDCLLAGLLRDIGVLLLQQTFPLEWAVHDSTPSHPLGHDLCGRERAVFGVDHAEVGAELLKRWNLPEDIVQPIRHHHHPEQLVGTPHQTRGELLWYAGLLSRLDTLVEHPKALDEVTAIGAERFGMPLSKLADFLQSVTPKIDEFAAALKRDIRHCPDYASFLTHSMPHWASEAKSPDHDS